MDTIIDREPFIQSLHKEWFKPYVANVSMLRLDVVHPVISGNKWFKLKYNIQYALDNGYKSILTFGGGYSNHLIATAAATRSFNIRSIGIVRGNYAILTDTLKQCMEYGMELVFVSKEVYAKKNDGHYLNELSQQFNASFIIPEGGANEWGRAGSEDIASYIPDHYTHICVPVGTGTGFIGLRSALSLKQHLYGYIPMKNGKYLDGELSSYIDVEKNAAYTLFDEWHFGGFGKYDATLIDFMNEFYAVNDIPLDIVYTSKMMYGVKQQLKQHVFPADAAILCIHTGGLQGNSSVKPLLRF